MNPPLTLHHSNDCTLCQQLPVRSDVLLDFLPIDFFFRVNRPVKVEANSFAVEIKKFLI